MFGGKILAIVFVIGLLMTVFRNYFWWILGAGVLIIVIRLVADLYWWYKDRTEY